MSTFTFDEFTGVLQAHEVRINRNIEKVEEKILSAEEDTTSEVFKVVHLVEDDHLDVVEVAIMSCGNI